MVSSRKDDERILIKQLMEERRALIKSKYTFKKIKFTCDQTYGDNLIAMKMLIKQGFVAMNEFINPKGVEIVSFKRSLT